MFQVTCKRLTDGRRYVVRRRLCGHAPLMRRVQARRASFHSHSHTHTHTHTHTRTHAHTSIAIVLARFYVCLLLIIGTRWYLRFTVRRNNSIMIFIVQDISDGRTKRKEKNTSHHMVRALISVGDFHVMPYRRIQKDNSTS